ncbi:MAG: (d)CMP kinase [Firmicutes bacterium]|nr:(d)CMP kinase [Clostridiales bacterium]MBQ9931806.1 (d)CMP kinase [Bacillota bacterium]
MDKRRIAIDGPSGAGKSTIAKGLAAALKIDYIDTGAMYRAVGYKMIREKIGLEDREALKAMLADTKIDFSAGNILLDGEVINDRIRTPEISKMASDCSALPEVREKLVLLQREMGQAKSVVMDGRDIGTNVLTDAEYKFFLTASLEERARRRWLELQEKGTPQALADVEADMAARDYNDSHRPLNPLRKAEDAIEVDSTDMNAEEVMAYIMNLMK